MVTKIFPENKLMKCNPRVPDGAKGIRPGTIVTITSDCVYGDHIRLDTWTNKETINKRKGTKKNDIKRFKHREEQTRLFLKPCLCLSGHPPFFVIFMSFFGGLRSEALVFQWVECKMRHFRRFRQNGPFLARDKNTDYQKHGLRATPNNGSRVEGTPSTWIRKLVLSEMTYLKGRIVTSCCMTGVTGLFRLDIMTYIIRPLSLKNYSNNTVMWPLCSLLSGPDFWILPYAAKLGAPNQPLNNFRKIQSIFRKKI